MICFMHGTNKLYLRFCTVADELNDKIYMLGGYYKTTKAYIYTISTNSWSAMWDSSLKSSSKVSGNYGDQYSNLYARMEPALFSTRAELKHGD